MKLKILDRFMFYTSESLALKNEQIQNPNIGSKVAGEIRSLDQIETLLELSQREANPLKFRFGTSSVRKIWEQLSVE